MLRWATLLMVALAAVLFGWKVPLASISSGFAGAITVLAITAAAILVRLNRGMPSLEWRSIEPANRKKLTAALLALAGEYVFVLVVNGSLLLLIVMLQGIGQQEIASTWLPLTQQVVAGALGGLSALSLVRITYVVWRDYDVVKLQGSLIDAAADREEARVQAAAADERIASIREAGLRRLGAGDPRS